jgi:hypothetical protein
VVKNFLYTLKEISQEEKGSRSQRVLKSIYSNAGIWWPQVSLADSHLLVRCVANRLMTFCRLTYRCVLCLSLRLHVSPFGAQMCVLGLATSLEQKTFTYFQTRTEAMRTMTSSSTEQTTMTAMEGMAGLLWYSASITCNNKHTPLYAELVEFM